MTSPAPAARPELLYIHDPLCRWCYAMSPVINRLQVEFAGRLDVSVLCGGMVRGAEVESISAGWDGIVAEIGRVEQVAGVRFGAAFRALGQLGNYQYDSEPPSRAIVAFRQLAQAPAQTLAFAHAVQTALFRDGLDLNDAATYDALLSPFGVDAAEFRRRFAAPDTVRATQQEFAAVARIGVQGFPTSIVRMGEQGYVLARGYQAYELMWQGLEQLLKEQ